MACNRPNVIPFDKGTVEYGLYEKLQALVANRNPEDKPRILIYTDIEQDYDDLLAVIFLAEMHRMGAIELAGCIANHNPAEKRAKFLRTVLRLLGLSKVPVAVGSDGTNLAKHTRDHYYGLKNETFENQIWNKADFEEGAALVNRLVDPKRPLTVLLISSLQDIGEYFTNHGHDQGAFLRKNFRKFVSQGGYEVETKDGSIVLNPLMDMTNNQFNESKTRSYLRDLVQFKLPSDAWSRECAKAARLQASFMESLFELGPIGAHLKWLWMRQEFKFFWDPYNWLYAPHLHVKWYLRTRLGLTENELIFKELEESRPSLDKVAPYVKVIAYDCCAAIGAVGDDFMKKMGVMGELKGYNLETHKHRVFGKKSDDLGGIEAEGLVKVMETFLFGGLKHAHQITKDDPRLKELQEDHVYCTGDPSKPSKSYSLGVFKDKILPLMKELTDHQGKAEKFREDAKKLLLAAEHEEKEIKRKELKKKLVPLLQVESEDDVPNRDTFVIPYEELYQEAMQKIKAADR
ncbi:hypothetical protein N0V88_006573 [Collariella sp. IMI 366227]|nr:hypothetical protein N0V88_006573 [Collariella sp. IMI 366227]